MQSTTCSVGSSCPILALDLSFWKHATSSHGKKEKKSSPFLLISHYFSFFLPLFLRSLFLSYLFHNALLFKSPHSACHCLTQNTKQFAWRLPLYTFNLWRLEATSPLCIQQAHLWICKYLCKKMKYTIDVDKTPPDYLVWSPAQWS